MANRHEKCKEPAAKPTFNSALVLANKPKTLFKATPSYDTLVAQNKKEPAVKPTKPTYNSALAQPNKPKTFLRARPSYETLVAENKKLKDEQEMSLAANQKLEDQVIALTKRNEELTTANFDLAEALAKEQATSKTLTILNENTKSLMKELTSQKLKGHSSVAETLTNTKKSLLPLAETQYVEAENVKSLQDWTVVRTRPEYVSWNSKLETNEKRKEMAKYLDENIFEETIRYTIIESMKLMFSKTFFVEKISFGFEKGRVYFNHSNLLKSLQIYLATKFPKEDTTLKAIQKRIRNFKDALAKNSDLWPDDAESTELETVSNNENLESSGKNDSGSSTDQDLTYCLCKRPEFGQMIFCDNDLCAIKWFHFSCVSLKTKPKGKWYCLNCLDDRKTVRAKSSKSRVSRNK